MWVVWHRSCSAWWQRNYISHSRPTRKQRFPAHLALNLAFKPWIPPVGHLHIGIISRFAEAYGAGVDNLYHELHQAKRLLQCMKVEDRSTTLLASISHIERYGDAFAELHRLSVTAISLPVSTASCVRSFSALRHIKTWVKTRCLTRNFTACLWLSIGKGTNLL